MPITGELMPAQALVQRIVQISGWQDNDGHVYYKSGQLSELRFDVGSKVLWKRTREEWFSDTATMAVLSLIDCFFGESPIKGLHFYIKSDHRYMSWLTFEKGKRIDRFSQSGDHDVEQGDAVGPDHFVTTTYDACHDEYMARHDKIDRPRVLLSLIIVGTKKDDRSSLSFNV